METITLKIDKRTKDGKTLLEMIEFYLANAKGVKMKSDAKKKPNARVLKTFRDIDVGKNLVDTKSHKDLLEKLYS